MTSSTRRAGFTLIELLVSVLVTLFVLGVLARSMEMVTKTVTGEFRQQELERSLDAAHRVMQDDVEALVKSSIWSMRISEGSDGPALAFLRYRLESPEDVSTEWVQYWREPHPDEARLEQWVRYSGPAENRLDTPTLWWDSIDRDSLEREVILDDLVAADLSLWRNNTVTVEDAFPPSFLHVLDVRLVVTTDPYPVVGDPPANLYERVRLENGAWSQFRLRPEGRP